MIKGLHNENEFYANFYWDNKLLEDVRAKLGNDIATETAVGLLKNLDSYFWTMKEAEGPAILDAMTAFYQRLFIALGYQYSKTEKQTTEGKTFSVVIDTGGASPTELIGFLVGQSESGAFEASPICFQDNSDSENSIVDYELSELLREELQESQNPPRWVLVGAPNALFLIERSKWAFGRYIRIEWQEIFLQRDSKPYEVLLGLTARKILCPDSGNSVHDEFDDNSHRHAFEVTTELRESVREAIELLINEMIDLKKESHQKIYAKDSGEQFAKELTHDALYYVYRLLFLLYLEAQGDDSDLLPLKSEIYRNGYSLEKLLELDFVDIAPDSAESKGTFLFESLERIFGLIFFGFEPGPKEGLFSSDRSQSGFLVKGIKSDLFDPEKILHLRGVKLSNGTLLEIMKKLSLTRKRERGGRARSRVSYANLGINQLGAVYEGLLSYTGFFAQEDLHALKPTSVKQSDIDNGKELDQVYLAPKSLVEKYRKTSDKKYKLKPENTVLDDLGNPKIYRKGSFVYRLAGRDRQKLASYYTPESLTKATVKYSLAVLFETKKTLDDLWQVKILEPAMGSGAFLNEAVNQLSERILELEVLSGSGELKTPKSKQKRLWEIKYKLIANNVYGVDLNPTAIELARFSLWLNCIGAGMEPPSFAGRLKSGNSLLGSRCKRLADGLFPWLMLDAGMLSYDKKLRDYDSDGYDRVKAFRAELLASQLAPSNQKLLGVQSIADATYRKLLNGSDHERNQAYLRLKKCCDLWCALFFGAPNDLISIPRSHVEYLAYVEYILGDDGGENRWVKLERLVQGIYENERFFHWDLEFPEVVSGNGFDLILGNPPWVAVEWQDALYVSDTNVIPTIVELNAADTRKFVVSNGDKETLLALAKEFVRVMGYSSMLETSFYFLLRGTSKNTYKAFDVLGFHLLSADGAFGLIQQDGALEEKQSSELRKECYRRFRYHFQFQNERALFSEVGHAVRYSINVFSSRGPASDFDHIGNLFLPSTIDRCYADELGPTLPLVKDNEGKWDVRGCRQRVVPIDDSTIQIFGEFLNEEESVTPRFLNLHSVGLLEVIKRIGSSSNTFELYLGGSQTVAVSAMLNETLDQDAGVIKNSPSRPNKPEQVVLSGPHINTFNPLSQETQEVYKTKFSYDSVDLENIDDGFLPRSTYQLLIDPKQLDTKFPTVNGIPYRKHFRLVTRGMVGPQAERSIFTSIIPPGYLHINGLRSLATSKLERLPLLAGIGASLIMDATQRIVGRTNFFPNDFLSMPIGARMEFADSIARRALALNGLTVYYDDLWASTGSLAQSDSLLTGRQLLGFGERFQRSFALRDKNERLQAMIEIDALVALNFDLSAAQLTQTYEILFPVLSMYDRQAGVERRERMTQAYQHFKTRGW